MDSVTKLLGSQCQLVAASGSTDIKTGYQAYGARVRVDNTQILSFTKIENDTGVTGAVTNESFENVNLLAGIDYISFEDPIIAITLASSSHSVMLFLEPRNT